MLGYSVPLIRKVEEVATVKVKAKTPEEAQERVEKIISQNPDMFEKLSWDRIVYNSEIDYDSYIEEL